MLDLIITLWSMSMFSLYFAVENGKLIVLFNIVLVYGFNAFIVAYRIYKWWKDLKKAEGSERTSFLSWIMIWFFVVLLFTMKKLNFISDIGMISALWLIFVLLTTLMTSCYVIMKDSKEWTNQIFNVCVLHWVLSHESKEWLEVTPLMLCIPIICIIILKIANQVENQLDPRHTTFELFIWIVIFALELAYDLSLLTPTPFYICVFILCYILVAFKIGRKMTILTIFSFIIIPIIFCMTLWQVKKLGWVEGMSDMWNYLEKKWKGHAIETDEHLQPTHLFDDSIL